MMVWAFWPLNFLPIESIYDFIQAGGNWKKVTIQTHDCAPLLMPCLKIYFLSKRGKLKGQNPHQFKTQSGKLKLLPFRKWFLKNQTKLYMGRKILHWCNIFISNGGEIVVLNVYIRKIHLDLVTIADSKEHLRIAWTYTPRERQRFECHSDLLST